MSDQAEQNEYSIAGVSKLTGVSCHVLRVWERRHGILIPHRSASGHRRYSREQVLFIRRVADLLHQGYSIGDVVGDLRAGRLEFNPAAGCDSVKGADPARSALFTSLLGGDMVQAEREYQRMVRGLSIPDQIAQVIEPMLVAVGEAWFCHDCEIFHERNVSGFLRRKLQVLYDEAQRSNPTPGQPILVGTVQGDRHEGGTLILCVLMELAGLRTLSMGVDLPISEYRKAITAWHARALCLSFVLSRNINKRFHELSEIQDVPVFIGGRSVLNYQSLARRSGLIPVPGPGTSAVSKMVRWLETTHGNVHANGA